MHEEILTVEQIKLLPLLKEASKQFGLVGGTAIAFYLGHRRSIDFDLCSCKEFDSAKMRQVVLKYAKIDKIYVKEKEEYTIVANNVKITFFQYPFKIDFSEKFENIINIPDLLTLAAMKAYALHRRAKWKDYVDLYFIFKNHFSLGQVMDRAREIFQGEFNEKNFRSQLSYFKDIDHSEEVVYLKGFEVDDKIIEKSLIEFSL